MRYLGIDFGLKRVGIAVTDETKTISTPLIVLKNDDDLFKNIKNICIEKEIELIVVGESKDFAFKDNEIMRDIKNFVSTLIDETDLPVHFHPEFMTSEEARRIQGENKMHDASAAAIILKSYIETKK